MQLGVTAFTVTFLCQNIFFESVVEALQ